MTTGNSKIKQLLLFLLAMPIILFFIIINTHIPVYQFPDDVLNQTLSLKTNTARFTNTTAAVRTHLCLRSAISTAIIVGHFQCYGRGLDG